ncbi:DKNYY domain-containing protein [Pseudomonas yamanorum]|uniref:DKNYY domain-containing protein n=1 Tax=Pseudomonas yamanorum TaxID=515393 RepID=UPI0015A3791C|nr:DKNYY domain-containing protein [Pseudomonas yamanorum]
MKLEYCSIRVVRIVLLVLIAADVLAAPADSKLEADEEFDVCREFTNGVQGECTRNLKYISAHYVVKAGSVYWMRKEESYERPCLIGPGAFFHNLLSLKCMRSKDNRSVSVQKRYLDRVAKYSQAFQSLDGSEFLLENWQRVQLANYAKDQSAVYYKGQSIKGADPRFFSVIFPFGHHPRWDKYSVSQSSKVLFLDGRENKYVDLSKFRAFTPVQCPGQGLHLCTKRRELDDFFKYGNWGGGLLGWIGDDIVFLVNSKVVRFYNMASPEMFMFASNSRMYVFTRGRFYEVAEPRGNLFEYTLIYMDVEYFKNNNY